MVPLMPETLYQSFTKLRNELLEEEIGSPSEVFVPVGALHDPSATSLPRVLYVGKATRDFEETHLRGYQGARDGAIRVVNNWLPSGKSAFWQFIRGVMNDISGLANRDGLSKSELLSYFGWTNLAKIGDVDENPDRRSLEIQKILCQQSLREEIDIFRPTAIVLATTNYAQQEVVLPLFGNEDWRWDTADQNRVAFKQHPQFGLVVWTNHPQGMRPAGTRREVTEFVARLIFGAWRHQSLPECIYAKSIHAGPDSSESGAMRDIPVSEFVASALDVLKEVERGDSLRIVRDGRAIARLTPEPPTGS